MTKTQLAAASEQELLPKEAPDWRAHLLVLCRLIIGVAFLYYSFMKLVDLPSFLKAIRGYDFLMLDPPYLINSVAIYTPFLELLLGFAALFGLWLRGAFATSLGMLLFFTFAVGQRTLGLAEEGAIPFCQVDFDCGCGTGEVNACGKIASNVGLIVAAALGLYCSMKVLGKKESEASPAVEH